MARIGLVKILDRQGQGLRIRISPLRLSDCFRLHTTSVISNTQTATKENSFYTCL